MFDTPLSNSLTAFGAKWLLACEPGSGWTSWGLSAVKGHPHYGREWLNSSNVMAQARALAASPLHTDAGFNYVNIDSFWAADPTKVVDGFGRWSPNNTRFPGGIAKVSRAVKSMGLRFGLYINPGVAVAAVKKATPIENTTCTAADIAVSDA